MGNLRSVAKALQHVGAEVRLVSSIGDPADLLVVPGQGHFGACVRTLGERNLSAIRGWIDNQRPYLGICLGLQLLFESSQEDRGEGIGVFAGEVVRFEPGRNIPHIGWNTIAADGEGSRWFGDLSSDARFYFVHSYFPSPADPGVIAAVTEHDGERFCSAVARGPLLATQFHPEKSGTIGLELLSRVVKEARAA